MVSYAYVVIRVIVMGTNRLDASLKTIIKNHEKVGSNILGIHLVFSV